MFENKTYENLLQDVLNNAPEDIDTRPGSIFYDAVSGILIEVAKLYTDLELVFSLSQIDTASGEYLDVKASEYGIERHSAVKAVYEAIITGTAAEDNERFFYNGLYFTLSGNRFTAEEPGTEYNNILSGTNAVPVDSIPGLQSAKFGKIIQYGADPEDDESLRRRVNDKISSPGENGNKQHFKIWCESVDGVGMAKIIPQWNGPNTVKAVLINANGLPCSRQTVNEVQEYVDPGGTGMGEGTASIGAFFTAAAAVETYIDISASVEISAESEESAIKAAIKAAIRNYLKSIAYSEENMIVRYSEIGALISGTDGVVDYSGLVLNGSSNNITVNQEYVPVLGVTEIEIV